MKPVIECDNCGTSGVDYAVCPYCQWTICEDCDHTCPKNQEECEHLSVRVEEGTDEDDHYVLDITCNDCGAELKENRSGDLVLLHGRAA